MASEDLKSTLVKKEREWKELQALHAQHLEDALIEATTELGAQKKQFQCLQEDFQFNLKLLEERDHKLECYDAMITKFQISDSTRQEKMSELHMHIGKLQEMVTQKKSQCAELLIMHQQEMAKLQLHLDTLSRYSRRTSALTSKLQIQFDTPLIYKHISCQFGRTHTVDWICPIQILCFCLSVFFIIIILHI